MSDASFADWKKRSKLFKDFKANVVWWGHTEVCEAAYKAGERAERKHIYEVLENAVQVSAVLLQEKQK